MLTLCPPTMFVPADGQVRYPPNHGPLAADAL
jgi:hypothetical protein